MVVPDELVDVAVVNAMGHHVFEMCDGSRSVATIAREIASPGGVDVNTVTRDVATYLAQLEQAGLVTTEDP